jgi:hypothetical protein
MITQLQSPPQQGRLIDLRDIPSSSLAELGAKLDDGLSPLRGIVAGALLSLPVWAGVGVVTWKLLH